MHYRNGREAKNGDKIVSLGIGEGATIEAVGTLHVDDLGEILAEKALDKRPEGM